MLVSDWQASGSQRRHFALADHIAGPLEAAFAVARRIAAGPIGVIGYCMGARRARATLPASSRLSCAARDSLGFPCPAGQTQRLAFAADRLARLCGLAGSVPVATIQTLFFVLDRFTAERKFIRVAILPRAHPMGWGRPSRPGCEPGWASDEEEASWTPGNPAPTFATVLSTRHFFL